MKIAICGLLLASFLAFDVPVYAEDAPVDTRKFVTKLSICKPTKEALDEVIRVEPQQAKEISDPTGKEVLILGVLNPNDNDFRWNYDDSQARASGKASIDDLRKQAKPKGSFVGKVVKYSEVDGVYCAKLESNFTKDAWEAYKSVQKQKDKAIQVALRLNEQFEKVNKFEIGLLEEERKEEQDRADYKLLVELLKNQDFVLYKPCCFGFCPTRTEEGKLYKKGTIAQIVQHPTFRKMIEDEKKLKKIHRLNSPLSFPKKEEMI